MRSTRFGPGDRGRCGYAEHLVSPEISVRHAKGVSLQWEEDNPPGSCCSSRKQPEQRGPVTARVEASGEKGPGERDQRARRLKHE